MERCLRLFERTLVYVKLCGEIKPDQIFGTLVVVRVVNIPSFKSRSLFVTPVDGVDTYTTYPGDPEGSTTYAMGKAVFEQVVTKANYVVHMHGGDANEALVPFTYFAITGNKKVDEVSEAMARSFPGDYVFPMTESSRKLRSRSEGDDLHNDC